MARRARSSKGPTVVSLFSGAGGLDIGLAAAGFRVAYASDIDRASCDTLSANKATATTLGLDGLANTVVDCADVRDLTADRIADSIGNVEIDLLAGGPPCQAFSVFGKRGGRADLRGQLTFEYSRLLAELAPRAFLFENVYGLLSVQGGEVFAEVLRELAAPGGNVKYNVTWTRVNARDVGVPQSRDRILIAGVRSDLGHSELEFELETEFLQPVKGEDLPWRTVADAFRGLPSPGSVEGSDLSNHTGRRHGPEVTNRYASLTAGERDSRTRINRLDPARPSHTIVVGSDMGGGKGHVHPVEPREVTPRESARIQTFPDAWKFEGNVRDVIRQVGNAVPPLLGFAIGNAVRRHFLDMKPVPFAHGVRRIGQQHLFEET